MKINSKEYVVVYGDSFSGLRFVGPFADTDAAGRYADADNSADRWVVIDLDIHFSGAARSFKAELNRPRAVLVTGSPISGMSIRGPFQDMERAEQYFDTYASRDRDTWLVELEAPTIDSVNPATWLVIYADGSCTKRQYSFATTAERDVFLAGCRAARSRHFVVCDTEHEADKVIKNNQHGDVRTGGL